MALGRDWKLSQDLKLSPAWKLSQDLKLSPDWQLRLDLGLIQDHSGDPFGGNIGLLSDELYDANAFTLPPGKSE